MMSKTTFRIFLGLKVGFVLLGAFLPGILNDGSNNQVIEFNSSIPDFDFLYFLYGAIILTLTLVAYGGLFFFKAWARDVFLTALIMTIPGYFVTFTPAPVYSGMSELLGSVSLLLSGFLIAVMYLTPTSKHFFNLEDEEPQPA